VYAGISKKDRIDRAMIALEKVGLADRSHHKSNELSGGQIQRVAIARALAPTPSLLLLDEPLTGLDEHLRIDLAKDLRTALTTSGITAILVTHDRNEAAIVADRVVQFSDLISPSCPCRLNSALQLLQRKTFCRYA
jgi:putative ABC transport system ATP-binding protein